MNENSLLAAYKRLEAARDNSNVSIGEVGQVMADVRKLVVELFEAEFGVLK